MIVADSTFIGDVGTKPSFFYKRQSLSMFIIRNLLLLYHHDLSNYTVYDYTILYVYMTR